MAKRRGSPWDTKEIRPAIKPASRISFCTQGAKILFAGMRLERNPILLTSHSTGGSAYSVTTISPFSIVTSTKIFTNCLSPMVFRTARNGACWARGTNIRNDDDGAGVECRFGVEAPEVNGIVCYHRGKSHRDGGCHIAARLLSPLHFGRQVTDLRSAEAMHSAA